MSSVITGNAANVSASNTKTISAVANTTPIGVTTSATHGFNTNDNVIVSGTSVTDGSFQVTVTGTTTFTLNGTTAAGTASAGSVVDISLSPSFVIPDDGDAFTVSSVNVAFEALADRTQFLALERTAVVTIPFTSLTPGTFTLLANSIVHAFGFGGGGGGGIGVPNASSAANTTYSGGSGGAGAAASTQIVNLSPGTYTVTVGAGGAGGVHGVSAVAGGANSTITKSGITYASWGGGAPGATAVNSSVATSSNAVFIPGGFGGNDPCFSVAGGFVAMNGTSIVGTAIPTIISGYGAGGVGYAEVSPDPAFENWQIGRQSESGGAGGIAGTYGTNVSTNLGGGGGGGGGGGWSGAASYAAGTGGAGGNGSSSFFGQTGGQGGDGSANSGSGGGGGGSAGMGSSGTPSVNRGGNGGSGYVLISYVTTEGNM